MNLAPETVWFLVGLVLMILELAAPGVVLVFFGAAAWIVALTTYMEITGSLASQLLIFSAAASGLLIGLRKSIKKRFFA
jgi:membrane protein implicated in regulation of membrane protease activity